MAKLVTAGFGGHLPPLGYSPGEDDDELEKLISIFEARTGVSPLIRARFDLDGDGVFEAVELDGLLGVSNVVRKIQWDFGIMQPGTCQITISNLDSRWSDNWVKSLTYGRQYLEQLVIVEINFDWIYKDDESWWLPIFCGNIAAKTEDPESQSVQIQLLDEYDQSLDYELAPKIRADELITYDPVVADSRETQMCTLFGKHEFCFADNRVKDQNVMVPMEWNQEGPAPCVVNGHPKSALAGTLLVPRLLNHSLVKNNLTGLATYTNYGDDTTVVDITWTGAAARITYVSGTPLNFVSGGLLAHDFVDIYSSTFDPANNGRWEVDVVDENYIEFLNLAVVPEAGKQLSLDTSIFSTAIGTQKLWFWLYYDKELIGPGPVTHIHWTNADKTFAQWCYINGWQITDEGWLYVHTPGTLLEFYDVEDEVVCQMSPAANCLEAYYFDPSNSGYSPGVGLSVSLTSHPTAGTEANYYANAVKCLYHILTDMVGLDADDFDKEGSGTAWTAATFYPGQAGYYSWDASAFVHTGNFYTCINIVKSCTVRKFIDDVCRLNRTQFFSGWGIKSGVDVERRIKFACIRAMPGTYDAVRDIRDEDVFRPKLSITKDNIYNQITMASAFFDTDFSILDLDTYSPTDAPSVLAYGARPLDLTNDLEDTLFFYNCGADVSDLADFLLEYFGEPLQEIVFEFGIKGRLWELTELIAITESGLMKLDPADAISSGKFILSEVNFNANSFKFTFKGTAALPLLPAP